MARIRSLFKYVIHTHTYEYKRIFKSIYIVIFNINFWSLRISLNYKKCCVLYWLKNYNIILSSNQIWTHLRKLTYIVLRLMLKGVHFFSFTNRHFYVKVINQWRKFYYWFVVILWLQYCVTIIVLRFFCLNLWFHYSL